MYGISMCAGLFLRYYSYVWCKTKQPLTPNMFHHVAM